MPSEAELDEAASDLAVRLTRLLAELPDTDPSQMEPQPGFSKEAQIARSPGGNKTCPVTGELKRSCGCWSCIGRRNRNKGKRNQNQARKIADKTFGTAGPTSAVTANEENWRHRVRIEVKSGQQVKALTSRFLLAEAQAHTAKAVGDNRPFIFAAAPDGMTDQLWTFRASDLQRIIDAIR